MALLESILIPLGSDMPEFTLKDPADNTFKGSEQYGERGLMVAFMCNHCPYAIAVWVACDSPGSIRARYAD